MTLSLRPMFVTPPVTGGRLRDLLPDSEGLRATGVQASSTWLQGKLTIDSQIAVRDRGPARGPTNENGHSMAQVAMTGMEGALRYGVLARTAGKAYVDNPNQELREVWGEYVYGTTRFRSVLGQTWNNVDRDPTHQPFVQRYGRLGVTLAPHHWPEFSMTYTRASILNAYLSAAAPVQRSESHSVEATLAYSKPAWEARLVSSYLVSGSQRRGAKDGTGMAESVVVSYRPSTTLTITPALGYRADANPWSGTHQETPSASASMNYRATKRLLVSALCGYSITHFSNGTADEESINSRALMAWTIPYSTFPRTSPIVALEATYVHTAHHSPALMDVQDVSGLLRVIVEEF